MEPNFRARWQGNVGSLEGRAVFALQRRRLAAQGLGKLAKCPRTSLVIQGRTAGQRHSVAQQGPRPLARGAAVLQPCKLNPQSSAPARSQLLAASC
jgi:hypothetical protein